MHEIKCASTSYFTILNQKHITDLQEMMFIFIFLKNGGRPVKACFIVLYIAVL